MKKLIILILLFQSVILNAQKVFLDENKVQISDSSSAEYYKIVEPSIDGYKELHFYITGERESENIYIRSSGKYVKNGKSLSWFKNGLEKSEGTFIKGKQDGMELKYYDNGQLKSKINYIDDQYDKVIETFWKNEKIKRRDFYNLGKFENGNCYDSLGNEIKHFDFEIMPQYKGGDRQIISDIAYNLDYPTKSRDAGIQGRVLVRFVVNINGTISSVSILEGASPELNEEAIRVVKTLKKFKPGFQDGEPVPVFYMVPITFTLK
ncbi:MAG: TonB family protein [Bacteroidales bacterium]|nr:TonB family protein [Bacteroidales bacterium]